MKTCSCGSDFKGSGKHCAECDAYYPADLAARRAAHSLDMRAKAANFTAWESQTFARLLSEKRGN